MAVEVKSMVAAGSDTATVLAELERQLDGVHADFVFAFYDAAHDDALIGAFVRDRLRTSAVVGGTSASGVLSDRGLGGGGSIGLLAIEDRDGAYGSAWAPLGGDPAGAAEDALRRALEAADSPGELPELIWIYQSPGHEEAVVDGLRRVVGDRCPVVGGSSADDDVSGDWRQLSTDGPIAESVVVGVLFSSGGIGISFQGGYEPTGDNGVVTQLGYAPGESGLVTGGGDRHILAIDDEPAAQVYRRWIGDDVLPEQVFAHGGTILAETTMCPLAVSAGEIDAVTHFRLIHPDAVTPAGGLTTFATIDTGTRVYGMRGDREALVQRVGRVADAAIEALYGAELAGGLLVYCGGCRIAVGDQIERVAATAAASFGGAPLLGCFTFGEQGVILDRNVHANLMISAIAFAR